MSLRRRLADLLLGLLVRIDVPEGRPEAPALADVQREVARAPSEAAARLAPDDVPLAVAMASAVSRCDGCGVPVDFVLSVTDRGGVDVVDDLQTACLNPECGRVVEVVTFAEPTDVATAMLVARLRPVVLGPLS